MVETTEKSQFNMAIATLQLIDSLRVQGANHYLRGDLSNWFFCLKNIKMQIIAKLNLDERKKLQELETEIKNIRSRKDVKAILKNKEINSETKEKKYRDIYTEIVERYNEMLQDLLEKKGMLLPNQEDETRFA